MSCYSLESTILLDKGDQEVNPAQLLPLRLSFYIAEDKKTNS